MAAIKPCLVSACLAGERCRYDGKDNSDARIEYLAARGLALPVCPELLGGLPVPRKPCELSDGRVLDSDGGDHSEAFVSGAREALRRGREAGCSLAVLKARSPSCGSGVIYDGSFSHTRVPGDGVFAALLKREGFIVYSEEDLPDLAELGYAETP